MLPTLEVLADGKAHRLAELRDALAVKFRLTEADREGLLPSGGQSKFDNRVAWAIVHMAFAQLLSRPARGVLQIRDRGQTILKSKPERIDLKILRQFPEYEAARSRKRDSGSESPDEPTGASPEETLRQSVANLRAALASELLERIKSNSPRFFEHLVLDLMKQLGYGDRLADSGEQVGRSGDGGIDGMIKEDRLGLDVIYLQAKRWESPVGASVVREFSGRARPGWCEEWRLDRNQHIYKGSSIGIQQERQEDRPDRRSGTGRFDDRT